jgi:predicted deacylase
MRRLGKNQGGYFGETINLVEVLRDIEVTASAHGWRSEDFLHLGSLRLFALHRTGASRGVPHAHRVYLSTGIHGDEPAGPLATLRMLRENKWPAGCDFWLCPCLNPAGFVLNRRENDQGQDLNRDYRHLRSAEIRAHTGWLERQASFDLCLCLHEDWESHGFYVYELNPDNRPSLAESIVASVASVCPIDNSQIIEGREARGGIIRPNLDPRSRPEWPEAFWLLAHKTRLSYTLESPSDFPLSTRVDALAAGVNAALKRLAN